MIDMRSFFTDIFPIIVIIVFLPVLLFLLALLFVAWLLSLPPNMGKGRGGYDRGKADRS